MVFEQTVETQYSLRELVNRIHTSIEYLNKYVKEHDNAPNPMQRVAALTRIVRERLRLQILVKKLGKAYLDAVDRSIGEVSAFVTSNPQYLPQLDGVKEQLVKNLKWVIEQESRERDKSHYLRKDARNILGKIEPAFSLVRKKIEALKRQILERLKVQAQRQNAPSHERGGALPDEYRKRIEAWQKIQSDQTAGAGKK